MYYASKEEVIMNQTEIGTFIARCRKEQNLTQAQLAEKLNITDRAISKWETGKSMPDSSIMLELCAILGISVNELLSGEKIEPKHSENYEKRAEENLIALKRKDENNISKNGIIATLFTVTLFIGIVVCLTCDIAISGHLTWSLIPLSSIAFAWVISFPGMILGKRGIVVSLISLSIFVIPYLYLLSVLIKVHEIFSIGTAMAIPSLVFLWLVSAIFNRMGKTRKLAALGISLLAAVPFLFIINIILSKMIGEPILDVWDVLTIFILLMLAFVCFVGNHRKSIPPA